MSIEAHIENKKAEADEYIIKYKQEEELRITQAWLTGYFCRAKFKGDRYPSLDQFIGHKKKKKMTNKEIYKQCLSIAGMAGGVPDGKE